MLSVLSLTIASPSIFESDGPSATTATVTRTGDTTDPLVVNLTSSDTTEATVPSSVTIPAGQASAVFDIDAVDDALVDGTQTLTITASLPNAGSLVLDPSFSGDGKVTEDSNINAIALQPDGKIITASNHYTGSSVNRYDICLHRYFPNGSLDTSFGIGGEVNTDVNGDTENPSEVLVQQDGKIVVAGYLDTGTTYVNYDFFLVRYNTDGTLDTSFDYDGKLITNFSGTYNEIWDAVIQPDGKILVGGCIDGDMAMVRYNTDGSLDTSFGSSGTVRTDVDLSDRAFGIALVDDGKILLAGRSAGGNSRSHFELLRYTTTGTLDSTFGIGGRVSTDIVGSYEGAQDLAIQADGKIVVVGAVSPTGVFPPEYNFVLTRHNPNGDLDTSFGSSGIVITDFGGDDEAKSVAIQADGSIFVAGTATAEGRAGLARYLSDGTLDVSDFSFSPDTRGNDIEIEPDGDVVLGGESPYGYDGFVARYANTSIDLATDTLEVVDDETPMLTLSIVASSVSESDGPGATTAMVTRTGDTTSPLVVNLTSNDMTEATVPSSVTIPAGQASVTFDIDAVDDAVVDGTQTVMITADASIGGAAGELDSSFGTGGIAATSLRMRFQPPHNPMAVQPDGKVLAAGEGSDENTYAWQITRLNSDGSPDTSFGINGIVETTFSSQHPVPHKIIVQADGKILVGGKLISGTQMALARYNADGSPDTSFGYGGIANLTSFSSQWIEDMALCSDGKIMLALGINGTVYFRAVRLKSDGTLDNSFGSGGIQTYSSISVSANAITVLADGRFLLSGDYTNSSKVIRANADGDLDTSFGTNGVQTINYGTTYHSIEAMAVDSVGRVVIGGHVSGNVNNENDFAVTRLNADGSFDTSFGVDGKVVSDVSAGLDDIAYSMVIQNDDKIVLAGYAEVSDGTNDVALVRYDVDGSLDTSFDGDGRLLIPMTSYSARRATGAALEANGKLVVLAGWHTDWEVARFTMSETLISGSDTLEVTDDDPINDDPVITSLAVTPMIDEGGFAELSLQFSDDNMLDEHTVSIDWGDGSTEDVITLAVGTRELVVIGHLYLGDDTNGTATDDYTIHVTVSDGLAEDEGSVVVTVNNVAPTADAGGPYTVNEGSTIMLDASGSTDPGNDIASYLWDLDNDGEYDDDSGVTVSYDALTDGNFTVKVKVVDEDGAWDTDSTLITVQVVHTLPGDANSDGKVDGSDVTILADNWQVGVGDGQTATWSMGDFNGDGKVDGSDVTILADNWQAGVVAAIPGDANGDGKVDGSDATIMADNWQYGVTGTPDATWSMGDFNGDGKVDGSDVTILADNWQAGVSMAVAEVSAPETETEPETKPVRQFVPPENVAIGVATVPRWSAIPPRRFITPTQKSTDAVLAKSTWSESDFTAVAKDLTAGPVKKSVAAKDKLFALELDPYADLE